MMNPALPLLPKAPTSSTRKNRRKYESPTMTHFRQKVAAAHQTSICNATKVGRKPIRDILEQDPNFQVPIFQRRYCWNVDQWDTLLSDAALGKDHSLGRLTCTNVGGHVVDGSPISHPNIERRSVILDGQQRFTTITLLLASIRDALQSSYAGDVQIEAINNLLFVDQTALSSWIENMTDTSLHEGMELNFAKLIPTYCDRWSYYAAILPIDDSTFPDRTTIWHRPLKAKRHFDSHLKGYLREALHALATSVLNNFHMLYFPIDLVGRRDGTEDLMVVYERLAMRDATFCKPHREHEYVSMDGMDMIRNLLLGSFDNGDDTVRFYKDIWLPIERMSVEPCASVQIRQLSQSTEPLKPCNENSMLSTSPRTMQGMIQSFLSKQDVEEQDAGTIGGKDYAKFQSWLEGEIKAFDPSREQKELIFDIGHNMLGHAKDYFGIHQH